MDIVIWLVTGGAVGWAAYALLSLNEDRGMTTSIVIGVAGGFLGGNIIAPMFSAAPVAGAPVVFSVAAVLFAAGVAAACLAAGNFVSNRWGV